MLKAHQAFRNLFPAILVWNNMMMFIIGFNQFSRMDDCTKHLFKKAHVFHTNTHTYTLIYKQTDFGIIRI